MSSPGLYLAEKARIETNIRQVAPLPTRKKERPEADRQAGAQDHFRACKANGDLGGLESVRGVDGMVRETEGEADGASHGR